MKFSEELKPAKTAGQLRSMLQLTRLKWLHAVSWHPFASLLNHGHSSLHFLNPRNVRLRLNIVGLAKSSLQVLLVQTMPPRHWISILCTASISRKSYNTSAC